MNVRFIKLRKVAREILVHYLFSDGTPAGHPVYEGPWKLVFHTGGVYVGKNSMSGTLMYLSSTIAYANHRECCFKGEMDIMRVMVSIIRELTDDPILTSKSFRYFMETIEGADYAA